MTGLELAFGALESGPIIAALRKDFLPVMSISETSFPAAPLGGRTDIV